MSEETLYESERTLSRQAIAATLRRVADAFEGGGPVPVDDDGSVTAHPPAESVFEVEFEREDDERSLEYEIEWDADGDDVTEPTGEAASPGDYVDLGDDDPEASAGSDQEPSDAAAPEAADSLDDTGEDATAVETEIAAEDSNATFELYRDRAEEWRWRLRHHNGNIIADSGEGYSKKANAVNGIESVKTNAAGAVVEEQE